MRLIVVVADGDPSFTWTGLAFIALFYVVFLLPGALALAWSRARWPVVLFGVGALAIPIQATGIATTDLAAVGPISGGQWALLVPLLVAMAAVYALQALVVFRVARSGRRDRQGEPAAALV
jgi:peptidoglycan/LPS O-acetylase OafA/YrhL